MIARPLAIALLLVWPGQGVDDACRALAQASRRPALEAPMHAVSDDARWALVAAGAVAALAGPVGRAVLLEAAVVLVPVNLVVEGTKRLVDRARPDGTRKRSNASFPSSHAANAVAVAFVLSRRWRRGLPAFLALAALVAWSRLYLDRHWLSDVLAGAALGVLLGWGALALWRRLRAPRALAVG